MANVAQFTINGASYTYDTESRNSLAFKNVKKAFDAELVYGTDASGMTVSVEAAANTVEDRPSEMTVEH